MAVATLAATVTRGPFKVGRTTKIYGTLAWSSATDTYATDGNVLDFSGKCRGSRGVPVWVQIEGKAGYKYEWVPGTTIANGKVRVRIATTTSGNNPLSQHSAATLDALLVADVMRFYAEFDSLL